MQTVLNWFSKTSILLLAIASLFLHSGTAIALNTDLEIGIDRLQAGQFPEAIASFTRAIETSPGAAYGNRCLAYLQLGDDENAIADCTAAIEIDRDNLEAYLNRGVAYYRAGKNNDAIADFDRVVSEDPNEFRAYYNRGLVYSQLGDLDKAVNDFDRAIATAGDRPFSLSSIYDDRGVAYLQAKQFDAAKHSFTLALNFDENNASAYYNLGCTCHCLGEFTTAIANFDRAIALTPNRAEAYVNRGLSYREMGNMDAALADLYRGINCFRDRGDAFGCHEIMKLMLRWQNELDAVRVAMAF